VKKSPIKKPNSFLTKLLPINHFSVEKSTPEKFASSVIFKKLSTVNNRPMGENSPILATLVSTPPLCLSAYSHFLLKTPVKVVVIVSVVAIAGFAIWGITLLEQKFDPMWFLPPSR
jgi:hypothetical protein